MANVATQMDDLDALFADVEGLGSLEDLEFEAVEVEAEAEHDADAILEAAQEELIAELDEVEVEVEAAPAEVAQEEVSMDDLEAELKTVEREKRLEEATIPEDEVEKAKQTMASEAKKQAKAKKESSGEPSAPREAIDVAAVVTGKISPTIEHWKLIGEMNEIDAETLRDEVLAECAELPKKTREKVVNILDWWVRGTSLSVYTRIAFDHLVQHEMISSGDLRNAYMSNPGKAYTQGTANAQTGQVMAILKAFRLIDVMSGAMTADHAMIKRYKEITSK